MKTWKITWKLALLLPFFFSLSACICHKHKLNQDFISTIDKTEFLNLPESYRLIHRVRLKVRKRSFDFIGYLAVNGTCWRAVAISEIGGTVFDLLSCSGKQKVIKCPHRFPTKPLTFGVLNELGYIFAHSNSMPYKTELSNKAYAKITIKVNNKREGKLKKYGNKNQVSLLLIQDNCLLSEIDIQSFCFVKGWSYPVPERLQIKNKRWGYIMQVELIRMDMRPVKKDVFLDK